jgi:hypothetical protein
MPHLCRVALHLQWPHREQIFLAIEKSARVEHGGRRDVLQTVDDLMSTATIQFRGITSWALCDWSDDCPTQIAALSAQHI